jgi:hypothetical protein
VFPGDFNRCFLDTDAPLRADECPTRVGHVSAVGCPTKSYGRRVGKGSASPE